MERWGTRSHTKSALFCRQINRKISFLKIYYPLRSADSSKRPSRFKTIQMENGNQDFDYDLVTIGAGSGGVRASRMASGTYGAKVS